MDAAVAVGFSYYYFPTIFGNLGVVVLCWSIWKIQKKYFLLTIEVVHQNANLQFSFGTQNPSSLKILIIQKLPTVTVLQNTPEQQSGLLEP